MGKKKRTQIFVLKPWCWYCEREFEDDKVQALQVSALSKKTELNKYTNASLNRELSQFKIRADFRLTNTLPGRDGYDIEIFGMEGVPANAVAEWKARKETEAGSAAMAAAAAALRPRQSYNVIPEADLLAALEQHKKLMAARNNPAPVAPMMPFGSAPPFPPGPPPGFRPPFPPAGIPPFPPANNSPITFGSPAPGLPAMPPTTFVPQAATPVLVRPVEVLPPKDGVMWPDAAASPAEKRAQQPRYRYVSPTPEGGEAEEGSIANKKRKAAADFL
ncbi:uncharacterized protein IL334_006697 [Kwoniella shivajii]|uniref:Uncharacterized protein n=1 Tax=Kwoniella shivajii TaxID=564305 RepID=A0ABZ1D7X3_9TREE|nr:hypothetical protein IL334_006697 [Kwoniella shivajii]